MPTKYVLPPEWEWPIAIALFIAGIASGTYAAMGLIHFAGDKNDQPVAYRLGFIPLPLMLVTPLLLPRFPFRHGAEEGGDGRP